MFIQNKNINDVQQRVVNFHQPFVTIPGLTLYGKFQPETAGGETFIEHRFGIQLERNIVIQQIRQRPLNQRVFNEIQDSGSRQFFTVCLNRQYFLFIAGRFLAGKGLRGVQRQQ